MKRLYSIIRVAAIAAVLGSAMVSCEQEPTSSVAKAVLGDVTLMNFSASNPAAQTVTVYSDGDWHTTAPEWITVDPSTGNGVTTVTVTAANNTDSQGMLEPRKDTLIISGNTLASRLLIFVSQEGDAYRNAQHMTLDKVAELADGKAFILDEATVVAVTSTGFVLNSGTTNVYIQSTESVKVGDVVSVKAVKGSPADEVTVKSSGTYTYPTPINLNEVIATYTASATDYVTVSGVVSGGNLLVTVDEVEYSVKQVDCPAELSISGLNGNKVDLTGYISGLLGAKMFGILTTAVKDNGPAVVPRPDKLLYAKWRFTATTMTKYQDLFGGTAGKPDATEGFGGLYVPSNVEGNGKLEYWQIDKTGIDTNNKAYRIVGSTGHPYVTGAWPGDYWQFSATDNYEYPAGTNLHIKFLTRVSATGQRYWMLEYFDGKTGSLPKNILFRPRPNLAQMQVTTSSSLQPMWPSSATGLSQLLAANPSSGCAASPTPRQMTRVPSQPRTEAPAVSPTTVTMAKMPVLSSRLPTLPKEAVAAESLPEPLSSKRISSGSSLTPRQQMLPTMLPTTPLVPRLTSLLPQRFSPSWPTFRPRATASYGVVRAWSGAQPSPTAATAVPSICRRTILSSANPTTAPVLSFLRSRLLHQQQTWNSPSTGAGA